MGDGNHPQSQAALGSLAHMRHYPYPQHHHLHSPLQMQGQDTSCTQTPCALFRAAWGSCSKQRSTMKKLLYPRQVCLVPIISFLPRVLHGFLKHLSGSPLLWRGVRPFSDFIQGRWPESGFVLPIYTHRAIVNPSSESRSYTQTFQDWFCPEMCLPAPTRLLLMLSRKILLSLPSF